LPAEIRHGILTDLKETRKQLSWGRLHELPAESKKFSSFQMARLLKRRQVEVETVAEEVKEDNASSVLGREYDVELRQAIQLSLAVHETDGERPLSMEEIVMSTQQQRKLTNSELLGTAEPAREYMLEFGGMLTDNIKDLLTKRPDSDATLYNDKDIVRSAEATPEKPAEPQTPNKTEATVNVSSGSDSDSDFVDVPDDALPEYDGLPKLAVLPIRSDGTPSKDFRLEDLNVAKPVMEIVIKSSAAPLQDDLFADIFQAAWIAGTLMMSLFSSRLTTRSKTSMEWISSALPLANLATNSASDLTLSCRFCSAKEVEISENDGNTLRHNKN
jgi:hypothetical protein